MRQEMMGFWDAMASAGPYANNLHLAPDNHTNTASLNFYRLDALPDAKSRCQSTEGSVRRTKLPKVICRGHIVGEGDFSLWRI